MNTADKTISLLLVDDHPVVRAGLRALLECQDDLVVVGEADSAAEAERVVERLGVRDRVAAMAVRSPADLERETGAVGGAIYGAAPHGRLATLRVPAQRVRGVRGLFRVGGTAHPGGGLPLVMLGGRTVARELTA